MGAYYARHDGLSEDIALAIEDHYKPRFAGELIHPTGAQVLVECPDVVSAATASMMPAARLIITDEKTDRECKSR